MCAEYIHDQGQRTAMVDLLRELEKELWMAHEEYHQGQFQEG